MKDLRLTFTKLNLDEVLLIYAYTTLAIIILTICNGWSAWPTMHLTVGAKAWVHKCSINVTLLLRIIVDEILALRTIENITENLAKCVIYTQGGGFQIVCGKVTSVEAI